MNGIIQSLLNLWNWIKGLFFFVDNWFRRMVVARFTFLVSAALGVFGFLVWCGRWIYGWFQRGLMAFQSLSLSNGETISTPQVTLVKFTGNVLYLLNIEALILAMIGVGSIIGALFVYRLVKSWIPTVGS